MLKDWANQARRIILEQSKRANVGHIGCALSIVELIVALYCKILRISSTTDPDRDRFVLSKGHAALALYAVFYLKGWISSEQLGSFCGNGSFLGVHPDKGLKGVDFTTGSLGHGLSYGVGAAMAARLQKSNRRVYVLLSDAECNEGSVWEAVMFAAHHKLANLTAIIDLNGQQATGYTKNVIDLTRMGARWEAFGWQVNTVDGHDVLRISDMLENLDVTDCKPKVVIAKTIFGRGVSFMENQIKWHYSPLNDDEYTQALKEINA